ncbi:SDR family NAD(P)-dependent oxidoreductase [Maribacter sp. 2307ULW6-5]|uniref:SDR family NAD(P)-dependent oxidoreductase n=1 Tax=Maribacter sp. 2307ULW6-5 TaxID=3386275 RepID=UPI0039BD5033
MDLGINGKTAVITGADSGIGKATAKILAQEGANLVLTDKDEDSLNKAMNELKKHTKIFNNVHGHTADITDNKAVKALADTVLEHHGGAHIVVNSAGARGAAGDFLSLTDQDWEETIAVDLMGAVRIARAFVPQMLDNGWGRMVMVASENAFQPYVDESPYNACKAAIINLSKCLSRSYSEEQILFNCVSPAFIKTPMTDAMMKELAQEKDMSQKEAAAWFAEHKRPHIEMERRGRPEEVAAVIAFLCSERASFVNGSNYRVDGGSVASAFG